MQQPTGLSLERFRTTDQVLAQRDIAIELG